MRVGGRALGAAPAGAETEAVECTGEALANATAVCTAYCGQASGFMEDCIYDVCRAGPHVAISDCLVAFQAMATTRPAAPAAWNLVGPGCCRPRVPRPEVVANLNRQHIFTRNE